MFDINDQQNIFSPIPTQIKILILPFKLRVEHVLQYSFRPNPLYSRELD